MAGTVMDVQKLHIIISVSCRKTGTLNMYEHQSTFNPNMPARFLIYLAKEYEKLVQEAESSIYGTKQLILPAPQCVVFYNGEKKMPEEEMLLLSDAFENKSRSADLELKVRMLNINYGHNEELMKKCRVLEEYAEFIDIARKYIADGFERNEAFNMAIDYCIDHDILSEFLRKERAEVLGMLLEEFDVEKYERTLREEGIEEGIARGIEQGIEEGIRQGREHLVNRDREKGYRYRQRHDALLKCVEEYNSEMLSYPLEGFDVKKYDRTLREEGREEGRKEIAMEKLIQVLNSLMYSKETATCQLVKHYELSEEEAATKVEMYWQS